MTALVPLYIVIAEAKTYREAFWLNGLQVLTVHLLSSFWLANFHGYAALTLVPSALGTAFIGACFGWLLFVPYAQRTPLVEKQETGYTGPCLRIFYFSFTWTLWEWVKSNGFLGYPWGTLSMSAFRFKAIIQIADITGTYGITFLFALFSAVCAEGLLLCRTIPHSPNPQKLFADYRKAAGVLLALFAFSFIYGTFQYNKTRIPEKFLNTVIVQQNANPWDSDENETIAVSEQLSESGIRQLEKTGLSPDLVVWSETVLQHPFPAAQDHYSVYPEKEPLTGFISRQQVPFIIGAPFTFNRRKRQYGNAAVLFDKDGTYRGAFSKIHLVPFAESIPGTESKLVRKLLDSIIGFSTGWKAGEQYVLFDIPAHRNPDYHPLVSIVSLNGNESAGSAPATVRISTPICFEDAFPAVCRGLFHAGSEIFVNLTDDSWSLTKSAEYQHFVIAAFRAIEYRTTLVRSTNSGYSVVVDPAGKICADLPLFTAAALPTSVPVYRRISTFYSQSGDWVPLLSLLFILAVFFNNRREKGSGTDC